MTYSDTGSDTASEMHAAEQPPRHLTGGAARQARYRAKRQLRSTDLPVQEEEVEDAASAKPDAQRSTPDAPPTSTAALARSLGLGRRALPPAGRLRSLAEVADYLGVSVRTVRRLIARGELRAHRVGRSLRVQDAEVAAYVAASMEQ